VPGLQRLLGLRVSLVDHRRRGRDRRRAARRESRLTFHDRRLTGRSRPGVPSLSAHSTVHPRCARSADSHWTAPPAGL